MPSPSRMRKKTVERAVSPSLLRGTVAEILLTGEILVEWTGRPGGRVLCDFLEQAENAQIALDRRVHNVGKIAKCSSKMSCKNRSVPR